MSKDIIGKLNAAVVESLADPAVRSRLVDLGMDIFPRERQWPEALGALVKADAEKMVTDHQGVRDQGRMSHGVRSRSKPAVRSSVSFRLQMQGNPLGQPVKTFVQRY
jgi:hypothetical protein